VRQLGPILVAALVPLLVSAPVHGDDFGYRIRAGALYSDNVGRTTTNETAAGIGVLGMQLWADQPEGRIRYSALSNIAYQKIFDSQFSGYTVGNLGATADVDIVPTAFEWNSKASFEEIRADLRRPVAPDNREHITTLGTGPTFRAQLGSTLEAILKGTYERSYFSERSFDSDTVGGRFDLEHSLSKDNHLGIGVTYDDVTFSSHEAVGSVDFTRREAFVDWKARGKRTRIDAEVGAAKLAGSGFESSGPLARVSVTRRLSPYASGSLIYNRSYPTSPSAFSPSSFLVSSSGASQFVGVDPSIATAAARRQSVAGVAFSLSRPRTTAELALNHSTEVGVAPGAVQDRRYNQALLSATHKVTPRVSAGLFGGYLRDSETSLNVHAHESTYGASLGTLVTRSFSIEVVAQRTSRSDATALGRFSEFAGGIFFVLGSGPVSPTTGAGVLE
jgi:hypothetical protein